MARARSTLAPLALVLGTAYVFCHLVERSPAFVPSPRAATAVGAAAARAMVAPEAIGAAVLAAAATHPAPALALEDEEDFFDARILAVLGLPLLAISWALFNVWRVAFRQVIRIGESASGSSKSGLGPED
mmetsp:Transcript_129616/g.314829  ORF Transcript_129616/g.314829 Transcript_129616/m.314829 type:complete len:130 (-) Transcript_129616:61-450(-)